MASTSSVTQDTPSHCLYCGNNPVNHTLAYVSQSLTVPMTPLVRLISVSDNSTVQYLGEKMIAGILLVLRMYRVVGFGTDPSRALSDRSRVIWEEAARRGIPMEQVLIWGRATEQYRAWVGGSWRYFMSLPIPPILTRNSQTWMDDKVLLKNFFMERGVSVPKGGRATSVRSAMRIFDSVQKPVIVKPQIGSRGRHTVTHIYTKDELEKAFLIAQQLCHFVVVEEHLTGSVYRGTYVGGEVAGILRGDPPRVTGDGVLTIRELILEKNRNKHERQKDFVSTDATPFFLKRQGYALDTVLRDGVTIDLVEKIGLSYGGFAAEDFDIAHPKLLTYLKEAGDYLETPIVGFDFISEDITKDPDTVRWGIIEGNSLPFIDLHHFPVEGRSRNVAAKVWDLWKSK